MMRSPFPLCGDSQMMCCVNIKLVAAVTEIFLPKSDAQTSIFAVLARLYIYINSP